MINNERSKDPRNLRTDSGLLVFSSSVRFSPGSASNTRSIIRDGGNKEGSIKVKKSERYEEVSDTHLNILNIFGITAL